jgi:hypothetical protein
MNAFSNILQAAVAVEQPVIARKASGPRKEWNPTTADIRIWGDGSVYPSQALVTKYGLDFTARILDEATGKWKNEAGGFGFDVFDTKNYAAIQNARFVAIAAAPRSEGRIDLFGSCSYHSQKDALEGTLPEGAKVGEPVTSVFDQGSNTFGKGLLVLLNEAYGVTLNEEGFIDLEIKGVPDANGVEQPFRNPNNSPIYMIPKVVSKGDKAGEPTYVRRENAEIWALLPVSTSVMGQLPVKEKKEKAETTTADAPQDSHAAMTADALN